MAQPEQDYRMFWVAYGVVAMLVFFALYLGVNYWSTYRALVDAGHRLQMEQDRMK